MKTILLNYVPSAEHLAALGRAAPRVRLVAAASLEEAARIAPEAEAILGNRYFLQVLPRAGRLRWMQSNSVGMDLILSNPQARERDFVLTNARGVYDDEVADHALALTLATVRGIGAACRDLSHGGWARFPLPILRELPTLIFGFGGVGQAIARRLLACGAQVRAVRRGIGGRTDGVARQLGVQSLQLDPGIAALSESKLIILALPLTSFTRRLFGDEALGRIPDGAFLVNIARGELIDEAALHRHFHRLGGVGLDVFDDEPLPPDHWLRSEPTAVLTPHVARSPEAGHHRWEPLFAENLRRWAAGEPLLNVVDKARGY